jgi:hypothetical protein
MGRLASVIEFILNDTIKDISAHRAVRSVRYAFAAAYLNALLAKIESCQKSDSVLLYPPKNPEVAGAGDLVQGVRPYGKDVSAPTLPPLVTQCQKAAGRSAQWMAFHPQNAYASWFSPLYILDWGMADVSEAWAALPFGAKYIVCTHNAAALPALVRAGAWCVCDASDIGACIDAVLCSHFITHTSPDFCVNAGDAGINHAVSFLLQEAGIPVCYASEHTVAGLCLDLMPLTTYLADKASDVTVQSLHMHIMSAVVACLRQYAKQDGMIALDAAALPWLGTPAYMAAQVAQAQKRADLFDMPFALCPILPVDKLSIRENLERVRALKMQRMGWQIGIMPHPETDQPYIYVLAVECDAAQVHAIWGDMCGMVKE